MQNLRDLCGMAAMGLTLRFGGGLFLMSFHLMTWQHPSLTRYSASARHAAAARGSEALGCAPGCTAACSSSGVQFAPQSTGHP